MSELPWAEHPLSRVASPEVLQKTGTGRGMSLPSPLCTKPVGGPHLWRPVTLGQWEGKAGSRLETQDTRILHWADLTQYWGVMGTVWGAGWAMGPAWVPCPKGVD